MCLLVSNLYYFLIMLEIVILNFTYFILCLFQTAYITMNLRPRLLSAALNHSGGNGKGITLLDAIWTCAGLMNVTDLSSTPLPFFRDKILQPCIDPFQQSCCGEDGAYGPAHLLFNSWFSVTNALLIVTFEMSPFCGDGFLQCRFKMIG